jgi:hypothetical protein
MNSSLTRKWNPNNFYPLLLSKAAPLLDNTNTPRSA